MNEQEPTMFMRPVDGCLQTVDGAGRTKSGAKNLNTREHGISKTNVQNTAVKEWEVTTVLQGKRKKGVVRTQSSGVPQRLASVQKLVHDFDGLVRCFSHKLVTCSRHHKFSHLVATLRISTAFIFPKGISLSTANIGIYSLKLKNSRCPQHTLS